MDTDQELIDRATQLMREMASLLAASGLADKINFTANLGCPAPDQEGGTVFLMLTNMDEQEAKGFYEMIAQNIPHGYDMLTDKKKMN